MKREELEYKERGRKGGGSAEDGGVAPSTREIKSRWSRVA